MNRTERFLEGAELWANLIHDDPFMSDLFDHVEVNREKMVFFIEHEFGQDAVVYDSGVFHYVHEGDLSFIEQDFDPSKCKCSTDPEKLFHSIRNDMSDCMHECFVVESDVIPTLAWSVP